MLIIPTDIKHYKYCSLISAETGFVFDKYEIPFTTMTASLKLVGSVNGLVCLTDDYITRSHSDNIFDDVFPKIAYQDLYMWNPCLKKYKCIVSSSFRKRYTNQVRISYALGFGFYEPSEDYRVVRIMYFSDYRGNPCGKLTPRVEVFSLRMNKWRPWKGVKSIIIPRVVSEIGTTVNSTVYWVNEKNSEGVWILSFDFNSEVFGNIKLPDDVCYSVGEIVDFELMKFEGSLFVCVCDRITTINGMLLRPCCMWLISHKDGIVSSTIRFRVVLEKFGKPLNITKGGALLMESLSPRSPPILSCNLKSNHYKNFEFYKAIGYAPNIDTFFIESLGGDELLTSAK